MLKDSFIMSWKNNIANKMRSFLTVLGIMIGIASIIALITIVSGVTDSILSQVEGMGANTITVSVSGNGLKAGLNSADLNEIAVLDEVVAVSPAVQLAADAYFDGTIEEQVAIIGRGAYTFVNDKDLVTRGRPMLPIDCDENSQVCLLSDSLADTLLGTAPLNDSELTINGHSFTVVGLLDSDTVGGNAVYIPYTTAMLYVQFSANVHIGIQEVGIVPNRAALGYTNMEGLVNNGLSQPGNTPGQGGNAEMYAISMTKLEGDGSTQNPLAGAKFKIYPSEEDAIDGTNAIQNPAGGGDWEVESNVQGVFEFSGLVGGDYWLVETVVPSGMASPQGPIKIELNRDNTNQVTGYVYRANIVNFPEFELPATGARTALIFTVAGLVLIAGGTLFLILRRRHRNN